ncbi:complement receptor type 2-like [Anneissia japonica]|uniref:complement receptor type 2-like n=1 Tax=Anneissia japonica TaxID=1529436 RepID=UPI001425741B|nr:complement receptor type 2-like [Anneissia japonica]
MLVDTRGGVFDVNVEITKDDQLRAIANFHKVSSSHVSVIQTMAALVFRTSNFNSESFGRIDLAFRSNCDRPPLILNGEVNSDLSHGGKTTFTCRDGYTLVGVTSTLCLDGQYQDQFPVCYANCKASISIANGQYTGSFNHGGSIIFTCDVGYTLVGESTITCDNGQYSSSYAECKANCDRPPLILNGEVNSDLSHGGKTTFTCRDGYTLVGVTSTMCLDGQYQDQFPVCYANCKASISIANGQYTGSFNHGGSIIFTCDVGYTLVGESTITCDNGQYSSSYAECKGTICHV